MYLPFPHAKVAYVIYKQMLTSKRNEKVYVQEFYKDDSIEMWREPKIKNITEDTTQQTRYCIMEN